VHAGEARGADDGEMLQVALRPAPVADDEIDETRRHALVGAIEARGDVHAPARTLEKCRLDKVVAQDMAAEGRPARQLRQARAAREGERADDGIVTPVVALLAAPDGETCGDGGPIDVGGEL